MQKKILAPILALALSAGAAGTASAALIQFNFVDTTATNTYDLSGQFTLDTSINAGTYSGAGDQYSFDPAALVSFDATVTERASGTTYATLGVDKTVTNGIKLTQGGSPAGPAGDTVLSLQLGPSGGQNALTGIGSQLVVTLSSSQSGYDHSPVFINGLLYSASSTLLAGNKLFDTAVDRDNFDYKGVLSGHTGLSITYFLPGSKNVAWNFTSLSVADVTPNNGGGGVGAVPLPAGGVLLLGGFGALGLLRRKRA